MSSTRSPPQLSPPAIGIGVGMGLLFTTLIMIGVAGNVLVCLAIYAHRKLRKKENLYFVSLAGADLLLCILIMPFAAYNDIAGQWPFGEYCKIWQSLDIMCCTASILHLCAVSFDRCYHIHFPMQYGQHMTARRILGVISLVWTLSATIAFAPLAFETHFDRALSAVQFLERENWTTPNSLLQLSSTYYRCSFQLEPSYAIVSSMLSFYLPSCIMIVAYTKLYKYARRHVRTIRHQLETATTLLVNVAASTNQTKEQKSMAAAVSAKRRDMGVSDTKARITLGVILGLFIFSWAPFFICNIVRSFCDTTCVPQSLFVALTWMGYTNSVQNPIIYSIFNRDFRHAFEKILLCGKEKKKRPSIAVNEGSMVIANGCNNNQGGTRYGEYSHGYVGRRLSRLP